MEHAHANWTCGGDRGFDVLQIARAVPILEGTGSHEFVWTLHVIDPPECQASVTIEAVPAEIGEDDQDWYFRELIGFLKQG